MYAHGERVSKSQRWDVATSSFIQNEAASRNILSIYNEDWEEKATQGIQNAVGFFWQKCLSGCMFEQLRQQIDINVYQQ